MITLKTRDLSGLIINQSRSWITLMWCLTGRQEAPQEKHLAFTPSILKEHHIEFLWWTFSYTRLFILPSDPLVSKDLEIGWSLTLLKWSHKKNLTSIINIIWWGTVKFLVCLVMDSKNTRLTTAGTPFALETNNQEGVNPTDSALWTSWETRTLTLWPSGQAIMNILLLNRCHLTCNCYRHKSPTIPTSCHSGKN